MMWNNENNVKVKGFRQSYHPIAVKMFVRFDVESEPRYGELIIRRR
jgi:hypothetical protein